MKAPLIVFVILTIAMVVVVSHKGVNWSSECASDAQIHDR